MSIKRRVQVERQLLFFFTKHKLPHTRTALYILEMMYPFETKLILEGVCPFCMQRFRRVIVHLREGKHSCAEHFHTMLSNVVDTYLRVKNIMELKPRKYVVEGKEFKSLSEAVAYALELLDKNKLYKK